LDEFCRILFAVESKMVFCKKSEHLSFAKLAHIFQGEFYLINTIGIDILYYAQYNAKKVMK
jgi:hypothetical protein